MLQLQILCCSSVCFSGLHHHFTNLIKCVWGGVCVWDPPGNIFSEVALMTGFFFFFLAWKQQMCAECYFFSLAFIKSKGWNNHATPRRMQLFRNLSKIKHENVFKHLCRTNKTPPCLATRCVLSFKVVSWVLEHSATSQGLRALPIPGNPASSWHCDDASH